MHELGVLKLALGKIQKLADENNIKAVRYVCLEIGISSGYVPAYFRKLYPAARELYPALSPSELKIRLVPGKELKIKEFAY